MAGFLDNIDTSEVKYTENYRPISKKYNNESRY